jgi:ribosome modulation factor
MGKRKDRAWLAAKVAELKAELERLPPERQDQFQRELTAGDGRAVVTLRHDPQAWQCGFDAGEGGRLHGSCPYQAGSTQAWSWFSGFIEGKAKRAGYEYTV